jgi:hypothetical protein
VQKGATRRAVLCYEKAVHIYREISDAGWGCGFVFLPTKIQASSRISSHRNFMMLCAALMDQPAQAAYFSLLSAQAPPSVNSLKVLIEEAWKHGKAHSTIRTVTRCTHSYQVMTQKVQQGSTGNLSATRSGSGPPVRLYPNHSIVSLIFACARIIRGVHVQRDPVRYISKRDENTSLTAPPDLTSQISVPLMAVSCRIYIRICLIERRSLQK